MAIYGDEKHNGGPEWKEEPPEKPLPEKKLTDDDFYAKYTVQYNHFLKKSFEHGTFDPKTIIEDLGPYNGCMYETYGEELAYVLKVQKEYPDRVWTIIDNNSGWTGICPGYHLVDRQGYLITDQPCAEEDKDVEYTVWDETEVNDLFDKLTAPELREIFPGKDISDFDDPDDWFQTPEYDALLEDWHELDFDRKEEILANWKKKNNGV